MKKYIFIEKRHFYCKKTLLLQKDIFIEKKTFLLEKYIFIEKRHFYWKNTFLLKKDIFIEKRHFYWKKTFLLKKRHFYWKKTFLLKQGNYLNIRTLENNATKVITWSFCNIMGIVYKTDQWEWLTRKKLLFFYWPEKNYFFLMRTFLVSKIRPVWEGCVFRKKTKQGNYLKKNFFCRVAKFVRKIFSAGVIICPNFKIFGNPAFFLWQKIFFCRVAKFVRKKFFGRLSPA